LFPPKIIQKCWNSPANYKKPLHFLLPSALMSADTFVQSYSTAGRCCFQEGSFLYGFFRPNKRDAGVWEQAETIAQDFTRNASGRCTGGIQTQDS